MVTIVFNLFGALFRLVAVLLVTGTIVTVLGDMQKLAFHSHRVGLVSMVSINRQLFEKVH